MLHSIRSNLLRQLKKPCSNYSLIDSPALRQRSQDIGQRSQDIGYRYFSEVQNIKIVVNEYEHNNGRNERSQSTKGASVLRIDSISATIDRIKVGGMKEVEVREACQALNELAHSIHKKDLDASVCEQRGELAWVLFRRLMIEDNLFDLNQDSLLPIHGYPIIVDHALCHSAIKCMVQSKNRNLFDKALVVLKALEEHFIASKSKKMRPVGRSYALLLDAVKDIPSMDDDAVVEFVEKLLQKATEQEINGNNLVTMNRHIFNAALNTLCSRSDSSRLAADMIEKMISKKGFPMDQASFSIALKAILSSSRWLEKSSDIIGAVEPLLLKMEEKNLLPSQVTMTPLLDTLAKRGNPSEVLRVLNWMEDMYQSRGWKDIRPNKIHFNTMISALSKVDDSGYKAMEMLDTMETLYRDGSNEQARPDVVTYNAVLNAIANDSRSTQSKRNWTESDIGKRAELLLSNMEDGAEGENIVPDLVSYNSVLSAYMNSNTKEAASRTQDLMQRMVEHDIEPDLLSYTICINTLAKSKLKGSAQKAEDLLRILEQAYAEGNTSLKPDVKCFNSVINAWAKSQEKGSIRKALALLNEMNNLRKTSSRTDLVPDAVSYTSIITSLAKQNDHNSEKLMDDFMRILEEDQTETTLDSGLYNALLHAQVQSGKEDSAAKAERLLRSMLSESKDGNSKVKPNTITFNIVLDAWSKSNVKGAAARAQDLLKEMQSLTERYPDICPDTFSFASVLNALANSPEPRAAEQAEQVLKLMEKLYEEGNKYVAPNTVCFATVIKAYSRSKEVGSAEKAENILKWMFSQMEEGNKNVKPNTISFTSVCDAWSKSGHSKAVKKVEELILWMDTLSASGFEGVSANVYTYNTLITAIARSKDPNKATQAFEVLTKLKEKPDIQINAFSYSSVMSACSFTHGTPSVRNTALRTAIIVLEEAVVTADAKDRLNIVYGAFFQTCANLMQKESDKVRIERIVEAVFHQCCDNGEVDGMLLGQVQRACSKQLYLRLLGNFPSFPSVKIQDVPAEWQKNVRRRR